MLFKGAPLKTWITLYHSVLLSITPGALWGIGYQGTSVQRPNMVASLLKANLSHIVGQQAFLIKTSNTMSDNFLLCTAMKIITVYDFQSFSTLKVVIQSGLLVLIILSTNFPKYLSLCLVISVVIISSLVWAFRAAVLNDQRAESSPRTWHPVFALIGTSTLQPYTHTVICTLIWIVFVPCALYLLLHR